MPEILSYFKKQGWTEKDFSPREWANNITSLSRFYIGTKYKPFYNKAFDCKGVMIGWKSMWITHFDKDSNTNNPPFI